MHNIVTQMLINCITIVQVVLDEEEFGIESDMPRPITGTVDDTSSQPQYLMLLHSHHFRDYCGAVLMLQKPLLQVATSSTAVEETEQDKVDLEAQKRAARADKKLSSKSL